MCLFTIGAGSGPSSGGTTGAKVTGVNDAEERLHDRSKRSDSAHLCLMFEHVVRSVGEEH